MHERTHTRAHTQGNFKTWLMCNLLGLERLMQNRATDRNILPAEKPLPCHMARKTPHFILPASLHLSAIRLPCGVIPPTKGSAWCKALLIVHHILSGREELQCRFSSDLPPPLSSHLPLLQIALVSPVYRHHQQRNMKHECLLIMEYSICAGSHAALFTQSSRAAQSSSFVRPLIKRQLRGDLNVGVLSDGEQAGSRGSGGGGDSEQPSFCLQPLNSCTAKVRRKKAQWGGALRQLRSRRTKGACCLRKHAGRRTSALKDQNKTKQTYATASRKVSHLFLMLFLQYTVVVNSLLKHLGNLVKLQNFKSWPAFNLENPLDYQFLGKSHFATINPASMS